jgi:sugar lactone lactonase YvrE
MKRFLYALGLVAVGMFINTATVKALDDYSFIIPHAYTDMGVPVDVQTLPDGNVWYVDQQMGRIIKVNDAGDALRVVGRYGTAEGEFDGTLTAITRDSDGNLYVLSYCHVYQLDFNGGLLKQWGNCGNDNQEDWSNAEGIHYDAYSDSIFVVDSIHNRVLKFTKTGDFISSFGSTGSGEGQFVRPHGITTDSLGRIYVVDVDNHRLQVFNPDGSFRQSIGSVGPGQGLFVFPEGVEIASNGNILVVSKNSLTLQMFDSAGNFLYEISNANIPANKTQFSGPKFATFDANNNIYVADWSIRAIFKFSSDGTFLNIITNSGVDDGRFVVPLDLSYDSLGNLYVLDAARRVQKFTNSGTFISTVIPSGVLPMSCYYLKIAPDDRLFIPCQSSVEIFDLSGNHTLTLSAAATPVGEFADAREVAFDSTDNIYVADISHGRLVKFDTTGSLLGEWGTPGTGEGQLSSVESLFIDSADNVYVGDELRIQKFDIAGNHLQTLVTYGGDDAHFLRAMDILVDSNNRLYVSDMDANRIKIFNSDGSQYGVMGEYGSGVGQLTAPRGIEFNPITGLLTTVDSGDHRIIILDAGVRIFNLIPSADVVKNADSTSLVTQYTDPAAPGVNSIDSQLYFGAYVVSDFTVNLTADRNWSNVNAMTLPDGSKSLVTNLNPTDAPGVSDTHALYVVKQLGQVSVYVCPNATLLSDVNTSCIGGYRLDEGVAPNLSTVNVNGVDYWKITGLTGTGAMSLTTDHLGMTLNKTNVGIAEPITMTVTAYVTNNDPDTRYRGTIHFTSTSGTAVLPANYTFTSPDNGVYTFTDQLVFTEIGDYTVTTTDIVNGVLSVTSETIHVFPTTPTAVPTALPTDTATPNAVVTATAVATTVATTPNTTVSPTATTVPANTQVQPTPTATDRSCIDDPIQAKCQVEAKISNVVITKKGDLNMEVCWDTNIETKGNVRYGDASKATYDIATAIEEQYTITNHCFTLPNLTDNTKYIFRIVSSSPAGKVASYDGDFTMGIVKLPITGTDNPTECISVKANSYSFNSLNQVLIKYSTDTNSQCSISYGNNDNRSINQSLFSSGLSHSTNLDLLKLDGKTDLYYQISCNIKDSQGKDAVCKYNDVIPASKYVPFINAKVESLPLFSNLINTYFANPTTTSQTLTTTAVAGTATAIAITSFAYPQWLAYGFLWLKGRNKDKPWGLVYNVITKEPVAFAIVRVVDALTNTEVKHTITDAKGRFGFVLDSGDYKVLVEHPSFERYEKDIKITKAEQSVNFDVPLTNQSGKNVVSTLQEKLQKVLKIISMVLTAGGLAFTVISVILTPNWINSIVLVIYIVQLTVLFLSLPSKSWGYIYDSLTRERIKGAFIRLYDVKEGRQIDVQITDMQGRYGFINDKKDYLLRIDAQGYSFPSSLNSDSVTKTADGVSFIKVRNNNSLVNFNLALDPK